MSADERRKLSRRAFLQRAAAAGLGAAAAIGLGPTLVAEAYIPCGEVYCNNVGYVCDYVYSGNACDWYAVNNCYDVHSGEYCWEENVDTGVPCECPSGYPSC